MSKEVYKELYTSIEKQKQELVKSLCKKDIDLNSVPKKIGITPLLAAIKTGNIQIVKILVENGADVNLESIYDSGYQIISPLFYSILYNNYDISDYLISKGADINCTDKNNDSIFIVKTRMGDDKAILYLIEKGADVALANNEGNTALHFAAQLGYEKILDLIISKQADLKKTNKKGFTALKYAIFQNNTSICRKLVLSGCDRIGKLRSWFRITGLSVISLSAYFWYWLFQSLDEINMLNNNIFLKRAQGLLKYYFISYIISVIFGVVLYKFNSNVIFIIYCMIYTLTMIFSIWYFYNFIFSVRETQKKLKLKYFNASFIFLLYLSGIIIPFMSLIFLYIINKEINNIWKNADLKASFS